MKPLDPELASLLESAPTPINNTDLGATMAPHLRAAYRTRREGRAVADLFPTSEKSNAER